MKNCEEYENVKKRVNIENMENLKAAIIFFLADILGVCMQTLKIVQIRPCSDFVS